MKKTRAAWATAAALAFIASLTLLPTSDAKRVAVLCLACGMRGLADAVLNVALFAPLGLALAAGGLRLGQAVPLGALLSLCIEVAQLFIPGRDASVGDVLTNTLGTALGVLAWRAAPRLLSWARPRRRALALGVAPLVGLGLTAGALLLLPALPSSGYMVLWRPTPERPRWFNGRVHAELAGVRLEWPGTPEAAPLSALWRAGGRLRVQVVPRGESPELAPIMAVVAGGREVLSVALRGPDIVLRYRTAGGALRLDEPEIRLSGASRRLRAVGGTIEAWRSGSGYCLAVDGRGRCGLGYGVARSWANLLYPADLPEAAQDGIDLLWVALLLVPCGLALSRRSAPVTLISLGVPLLALPPMAGLAPTSLAVYGAALLGLSLGAALRRGLHSAREPSSGTVRISASRQRSILR